MTTSVVITCPTPNHKRVLVQQFYAGGGDQPPIAELTLEHGQSTLQYVHSGNRLVIEEIE